jgi:two-component system cell cycle sensor histidine kinase/response regulator CckA
MTSSSAIRGKRGGGRILVVDDEAGILQYIRRVLEHCNHTVLTSRSGEHAWGVVRRNQAKLDLVLTDIVMPGLIDGPTLAAKIQRRYRKLPVLFMTGALPENDEQVVEIARKRRLLRKPFSPQQLVELIDSHFGESEAET